MHTGHLLREGAGPEIVRDNMGHANIDVTQNIFEELVGRTSGCEIWFVAGKTLTVEISPSHAI